MLTRRVCILGTGWWSAPWPSWDEAAAALRGGDSTTSASTPPGTAAAANPRPAPQLLSANEHRRAPETVLMALHAAEAACAAAGVAPHSLPSVFATAHADLAIVDALCQTLARDPLQLSPMRFHHSVHNAASGYWAIAARNHQASTALAAAGHSFAAGLLEALVQCQADDRAVLLVACDHEAVGPLRSVHPGRGALAVALVLAPAGPADQPAAPAVAPGRALHWALQAGAGPAADAATAPHPATAWLSTPLAAALPLFQALAGPAAARVSLPLGGALSLQLDLPPDDAGA